MSWLSPTINALRPNASKAFEAGAFTPTSYADDHVVGTVVGYPDYDDAATLTRLIPTARVLVSGRASKCSLLTVWHGAPAPDPNATYVKILADAPSLEAISNGASVSIKVS
jgi:hypothetical protein